MRRYTFHPHESIPGAWLVENQDGLPLGSLIPDPLSATWTIYFGPGRAENLGRCNDREVGAQILGFYRKALIGLQWLKATGQVDFLHQRFNRRRGQ